MKIKHCFLACLHSLFGTVMISINVHVFEKKLTKVFILPSSSLLLHQKVSLSLVFFINFCQEFPNNYLYKFLSVAVLSEKIIHINMYLSISVEAIVPKVGIEF